LFPQRALPLSETEVATPAYLSELLQEHGTGVLPAEIEINAAMLTSIRSVSSNCNNRVVDLEYESTSARSVGPPSMFLKIPVDSLATRIFFNVINSWELECHFYRRVSPRLPIRNPAPYAVVHQGSRFIMLLENLYSEPDITLHINADMITGPSLETTRRCLNTMAKFHAHFHDIDAAEREKLLPARLQPFTSPIMRSLTPLMSRRAMAKCMKRDDISLSPEHGGLYYRVMDNWDALVDWWSREPLTLVHGDSHLGNHFLFGDSSGMLDWQAAQWGKGIRDVQYFLTDSLPADLLAAHERELVGDYLDSLAGYGVEQTFDEIWYQYRGFSFQTWMTIIVSMGFAVMTDDMNSIMPEIHRRCIASIERLDLQGWMDEVLTEVCP
jgi:aminoglycoside phosphotransferase (APT) family kinase protein